MDVPSGEPTQAVVKELSELLGSTLEETEKIERRSAERLKANDGNDGKPVPVRVVLMHFESPPPEPTAKKRGAASGAAHAQES